MIENSKKNIADIDNFHISKRKIVERYSNRLGTVFFYLKRIFELDSQYSKIYNQSWVVQYETFSLWYYSWSSKYPEGHPSSLIIHRMVAFRNT